MSDTKIFAGYIFCYKVLDYWHEETKNIQIKPGQTNEPFETDEYKQCIDNTYIENLRIDGIKFISGWYLDENYSIAATPENIENRTNWQEIEVSTVIEPWCYYKITLYGKYEEYIANIKWAYGKNLSKNTTTKLSLTKAEWDLEAAARNTYIQNCILNEELNLVPAAVKNSFISVNDGIVSTNKYDSFTHKETLLNDDGISLDYNIEVSYSTETYTSAIPYTADFLNPFENAEPYFYGEGSPNTEYFKLDGGPLSDAIKVQAAIENDYSEIKNINTFQIKGNKIQYIKKGTFPIISTSHKIQEWTESTTITVIVSYDDNNEIQNISYGTTAARNNINLQDENFVKHNLETLPSTLGFVLVGAGGGAGGITQFDPKKNWKDRDQWACPGSGGGGGETIWGVLNLKAPETDYTKSGIASNPNRLVYTLLGKEVKAMFKNSANGSGEGFIEAKFDADNNLIPLKINYLTYTITIGAGGAGGGHGKFNIANKEDDQSFGEDGKNGADSIIKATIDFDVKDKAAYYVDENHYLEETKPLEDFKLTAAASGKKGNKGVGTDATKSYKYIEGGKGGSYTASELTTLKYNPHDLCIIRGRQAGGDGASIDPSITTVSNPALNFTIGLDEEAKQLSDYSISRGHSAIYGSGAAQNGKGNKDFTNTLKVNVPGGHSYGSGKTKTTNGGIGGGGACCRNASDGDYNKDKDFHSNVTFDDGHDGGFMLYY